jgi:DNA-3-methyladenine glycosylase II
MAFVWRGNGDFRRLIPSKNMRTTFDITRNVASTDVSDIQKCGLSMRKARYIKGIGEAAVRGDLDLLELKEMPDAGVIEKLSSLPGIGVWTAQMLLIFSLCRPDVVSWGDLGIRRGMMNLYRTKRTF